MNERRLARSAIVRRQALAPLSSIVGAIDSCTMSRAPTSLAFASFAALSFAAALAGCRTETTHSPINLDAAVVSHARAVSAWEVWDQGRCAGSIVRYEDVDRPSRGYYSVRNRDQQALGMVDFDGRAWRYRPHQRDPDWLGTGTVAHATSWILGCSEACELVPVPLESVERDSASTAR
jgi:hypothetical protein